MYIEKLYLRTYMQTQIACNNSDKGGYLFEGERDMGRKEESDGEILNYKLKLKDFIF